MYHLIELKQKKLLISRQTLKEIYIFRYQYNGLTRHSFIEETWVGQIFERLFDFDLVIAVDLVDPIEELQKKSAATIAEDSIIRPALGGK